MTNVTSAQTKKHWNRAFLPKNAEIGLFLLFAVKAAKIKLMHKIEKRFCLCFFCLLGHTPFSSGARLEGLGNRGIPFRLSGAARRPLKQRNPFPASGCGAKASETEDFENECFPDIFSRSLWEPLRVPHYSREAILQQYYLEYNAPNHHYFEINAPRTQLFGN